MTDLRRARRKRPRVSEPVSDIGVSLLHSRGELTIEDVGDPDQPNRTIRRGRRVWAPDVLLANGTISQRHHAAATRYHDAYEVGILGARDRLAVYVDCRGAPAGIADAQLAAATDYRQATQAVGLTLSASLTWCVLGCGTVAGWAEDRGWNPHRAQGYLLAALDRLTDHYETG